MNVKFKDKIKEKENILLLILILTFMSLYLYKDFLTLKKLYIYNDSGGDTLISYWPYYENIVSMIKQGKFSFWHFQNGIGNNIFSRPSDLVDPFNIIFYIVGVKNIPYTLGWIAFIKIILAGIFFYLYLTNFNFSKYTYLLVSILYAFNGYIVLWGQHYAFATIMVFAPILLNFYEQWFKKGKWLPFTLIITLISMYSLYFFYMFSIYLFIYALFRYLLDKKFMIKKFAIYFIKTIGLYMLGIGVGAIITLPAISVLISNTRIGGSKQSFKFFQFDNIINYISMVERLFTNNIIIKGHLHYDGWWIYYESPILYCGIITILLIPQIIAITNKKEKILYCLWIGLFTIFLIFPFFSYMMNGFSVVYYRWTFMIILFELYILSNVINKFENGYKLDIKILILTYIVLCIMPICALYCGKLKFQWTNDKISASLQEIKLVILYLSIYSILLVLINKKRFRFVCKSAILSVVCVELLVFSNFTVNDRTLIDNTYFKEHKGYFDSTKDAIQYIKQIDNSIFRVDKGFVSQSFSEAYMQDYYGIKAYDSSNNPQYLNFIRELSIDPAQKTLPNFIGGFGGRTKLQTLLGVKYYIAQNNDDKIPYGYVNVKKLKDISIYENKYFLPLGYTYDSYMTYSDFEKLNVRQKDDALLTAFISDKEVEGLKKVAIEQINTDSSELKIKYQDITFNNIKVLENGLPNSCKYFAVNGDPNITIPIDSYKDHIKDIVVKMEVISEADGTVQIFWKTKDKNFREEDSKTTILKQGHNKIQLELNAENIDAIRLDVGNKKAKYEIKDLTIMYIKPQSFEKYREQIEKLKEEFLKVDYIGKSRIRGNINLKEEKLLCLAIPYDKGWKAFVDNKEVKIEKVNVGFIGMRLEKGNHTIELKYTPPYLKVGLAITSISIIITMFLLSNKRYLKGDK